MKNGTETFTNIMRDTFAKNARFLLKRPAYLKTFSDITAKMNKQSEVRKQYTADENLVVPPVLIVSITNDCNLSCKGCYACEQHRDKTEEMAIEQIDRIIGEAVDLGVAVVLIAGGEPLMKEGILELPKKYPSTLFVMFTNGLLIRDDVMNAIREMRNLIPIVSIEGNEATTDERRGNGMYEKILGVMNRLDKRNMLFGASVTLTSTNFEEVIHSDYLQKMEDRGCRAAFLIEYVPNEDDFELCLTEEQKDELHQTGTELTERYNMMVVLLPGDEEKFGGCLAAGRGFLHIGSTGAVEACPFAPYSDLNVKDMPLKDALRSELLREIRDNHHLLKESKGGCALKENKEWVAQLMKR